MSWFERWRIAVRYTFAFGQGHLSAFLSSLSMLGLVLQGLAGAAGGYVFHLVKARADLPPGPDASSNAS